MGLREGREGRPFRALSGFHDLRAMEEEVFRDVFRLSPHEVGIPAKACVAVEEISHNASLYEVINF